jgi:uncharacterized protein YggT (Ycf19 family)
MFTSTPVEVGTTLGAMCRKVSVIGVLTRAIFGRGGIDISLWVLSLACNFLNGILLIFND